MSSYAKVQQVLEETAESLITIPIDKENSSYKPELEQEYARTTLIPTESTAEFIGVNTVDNYSGLFQIDLFYPSGNGTYEINATADKIINGFLKINHHLGDGELCVRIINAWRTGALQETDWYNIPVIVQWELFS